MSSTHEFSLDCLVWHTYFILHLVVVECWLFDFSSCFGLFVCLLVRHQFINTIWFMAFICLLTGKIWIPISRTLHWARRTKARYPMATFSWETPLCNRYWIIRAMAQSKPPHQTKITYQINHLSNLFLYFSFVSFRFEKVTARLEYVHIFEIRIATCIPTEYGFTVTSRWPWSWRLQRSHQQWLSRQFSSWFVIGVWQ